MTEGVPLIACVHAIGPENQPFGACVPGQASKIVLSWRQIGQLGSLVSSVARCRMFQLFDSGMTPMVAKLWCLLMMCWSECPLTVFTLWQVVETTSLMNHEGKLCASALPDRLSCFVLLA